jgi:hypothetical protein
MSELVQNAHQEHDSSRQNCLTETQRQSLDGINDWLQREKRQDGTDTWWRFFDAGVRDEKDGIWSIYNDFHRQESGEGWRVFYCPPTEEQFHQLQTSRVVHTDIPGSSTRTVQLDVGNEANRWLGMFHNDILNIGFSPDRQPSVRFWSDLSAMEPVPVAAEVVNGDAEAVGRFMRTKLVSAQAVGDMMRPAAA